MTAKTTARTIASGVAGTILGVPAVIIAGIPAHIATRAQANNPDVARFQRLHAEITYDLAKILQTLNLPTTSANHVYLQRQIDKYLRPGIGDSVLDSVTQLFNFFNNPAKLHHWSYGGWESRREAGGVYMYLAFGHATVGGDGGGFPDAKIRISPKAFCLPDTVLAGVMLHEATHWVLETLDHAYDTTFFPGHGNLKELSAGLHFSNADNWRIFYQKMRKHFRA